MTIALALIVTAVLIVAVAAILKWGNAPSSARQREQARRNYLRDVENDR